MLFVSWNVNGLRACLNKGFQDFFLSVDADIFQCGLHGHSSGKGDVWK